MNLYITKLISSCLKQTPTLRMVTQNSVKTPKEVDRAKEALAADTTAILMVIAETAHSLISHSKKIRRQFYFQSYNHQKWTSIESAQKDS